MFLCRYFEKTGLESAPALSVWRFYITQISVDAERETGQLVPLKTDTHTPSLRKYFQHLFECVLVGVDPQRVWTLPLAVSCSSSIFIRAAVFTAVLDPMRVPRDFLALWVSLAGSWQTHSQLLCKAVVDSASSPSVTLSALFLSLSPSPPFFQPLSHPLTFTSGPHSVSPLFLSLLHSLHTFPHSSFFVFFHFWLSGVSVTIMLFSVCHFIAPVPQKLSCRPC